jgi:hypothetical protein
LNEFRKHKQRGCGGNKDQQKDEKSSKVNEYFLFLGFVCNGAIRHNGKTPVNKVKNKNTGKRGVRPTPHGEKQKKKKQRKKAGKLRQEKEKNEQEEKKTQEDNFRQSER